MSLDSPHADLEVGGDHLAGFARPQQFENFTLPGRERCKILLLLGTPFLLDTDLFVLSDRGENAVKQRLIVERLLQEIERTLLHGTHGYRYIAVASDDDDRNTHLSHRQVFLQLEAAHARHADVENQTPMHVRIRTGQ